jgi:hypothetical protein
MPAKDFQALWQFRHRGEDGFQVLVLVRRAQVSPRFSSALKIERDGILPNFCLFS